MPFGQPPIMGAGVGLPGTPQEDFIRQRAQAEKMKKFERESMAQGLGDDPTASEYSEAFHNMGEYGFDAPPDVPTYGGWPAQNLGPVGGVGWTEPAQPGAVDPEWGIRQFPSNFHDIPSRNNPAAFGGEEWKTWQRYRQDQRDRGKYNAPLPPGVPKAFGLPFKEQLPATKVYSAPIPAMFPKPLRPPQPPG